MEVARSHLHHQQQQKQQSSLVTCSETSSPPEKVCAQSSNKTKVMPGRPAFKKVQVVYYLSRNGHLEHPHYIEVTHLAHKPLRLKDFMDRLTSLRGKGMPSLYSWSCKRSYKNGYVWNDLAENDVIYPSEGAEYVLKGSEIVEGCTEQPHRLQAGNNKPRVKLLFASKQHQESVENGSYYQNPKEDDEEDECNQHKLPYSTCSRGVSTDEAQQMILKNKPNRSESVITALDINPFLSPPASTTSSSETNEALKNNPHSNTTPKRFVDDDDDDDDRVGNDPLLSRSSMLFSLIACGGSTSFRKSVPAVADHEPSPPTPPRPPQVAARKSVSGSNGINLHRGVVCKAASAANNNKVVEEDEIMIKYMSENPRFGNLHCEEKEYFSGSIVESVSNDQDRPNCVEPGFLLQKSSSYNEERSNKEQLMLEEVVKEEVVKKEKGSSAKGRCIPRMMMCHQPNNQKN